MLWGFAMVGWAQDAIPDKPRFPMGGATFNYRMNGGGASADDPVPVVVVLLRDGRYLEFAPADVLTLRHLVDKLPADALTPTCRLLLLRNNQGTMFSAKGLQTEDLTKYSLTR
jgi:hypothetical protein